MNKYYDINMAAEEAGKNAMPTPCEMFNKMQGLQHDYDMLLMRYTRKCKERDDVMRTLDQTTVKLNDETARADALQRRCDDLEKSRQAWAIKAMDAAEEIRKMLSSEYSDFCEFCAQDNNDDAECARLGGYSSWCCENAKWRGRCDE